MTGISLKPCLHAANKERVDTQWKLHVSMKVKLLPKFKAAINQEALRRKRGLTNEYIVAGRTLHRFHLQWNRIGVKVKVLG